MHWKKSLLVIYKMLRLFVKTLSVDEKHYLLTRDNLTQAIEVELSLTQKTFCQFCFAFLETLLNFKYSPKNDDPHS